MIKQLTLVVPYTEQQLQHESLPTATKTLRSFCQRLTKQTLPAALQYYDIEAQAELPLAAITAAADGLETQDGVWLRADPVDLRTDINSVYFFGQQQLQFTFAQAQAIATKIAPLFVDYGYQLLVPDAYRWYLKAPTSAGIKTSAPSTMLGLSIRDYLQETDSHWRKLFTEVQMSLHLMKENQQLAKPITGLWFWGEGSIEQDIKCPWQNIIADDPISLGIAKFHDIAHTASNNFLLTDAKDHNNTLLVLEQISDKTEQLLDKVLCQWRKQHIEQLNVYWGGTEYYQLQPHLLKRWWQFWRA